MATKYNKLSQNIPIFSIPRPSKVYPKWDFGYENIPSGNSGQGAGISLNKICPYIDTYLEKILPRKISIGKNEH
jgi:hypothetical protein